MLLDMLAGAMHANECVLCISDEIVFVSVVFPLRAPQSNHREKLKLFGVAAAEQRNGKMCNDFSLSCHSAFKLRMMCTIFSGYLLNVNYICEQPGN